MSSNNSPPVTLQTERKHLKLLLRAVPLTNDHSYSQVKDQVMETLLRDAVVQTHCSEKKKKRIHVTFVKYEVGHKML